MRNSGTFFALSGLALGLVFSIPSAWAQGRGGGGQQGGGGNTGSPGAGNPAPGGNVGGNTGRPTTPTPTTPNYPSQQQQQQPQLEQMPRTYFLSGKVMMDDGTPPPEAVVIERVCGGMHRPEAYTDSKGRFSFQLGQSQQMLPDASVGSTDMDPMGSANPQFGGRTRSANRDIGGYDTRMMGCEIRASLAGYRSDVVSLAGRRSLDNPEVGTIILHRLGNVEGTTISATSLNAPKDAKKAYEKGLSAMKKQKWEDAQTQLQKAVEIYPKYAAAWNELGDAFQRQNNAAEARKAYAQALSADPKYLKPYRQIAVLAMNDKNWQEVADTTSRLIRLDPVDYPDALLYNAIANVNLHKMDDAERSAREAVKVDTDHQYPRAEYVLGFILANKQDYAGALPLMKSYVQRSPDAPDVASVQQQIAQIEKVSGTQQPAAQQTPAQP